MTLEREKMEDGFKDCGPAFDSVFSEWIELGKIPGVSLSRPIFTYWLQMKIQETEKFHDPKAVFSSGYDKKKNNPSSI